MGVLIILVSLCIWPGSLFFFSIMNDKRNLHGHTTSFCSKHKCKHCELWNIKGVKGTYQQYKCSRPYCVIDNSGKDEYDFKVKQEQERLIEINKNNKDNLVYYFENNKNLNDFVGENFNLKRFINNFNINELIEIIKKFPESKITIESFFEINDNCYFVNKFVEELLKIDNSSFNEVFEIILKTSKKRGKIYNYYLDLFLLSVAYKNLFLSEKILSHITYPIEIDLKDSKITDSLIFNIENLSFFNTLNQNKIKIKNIDYGFDIFLKLNIEHKELFAKCIVEKHIYKDNNRKSFINKVLDLKDFSLYDLLFKKNNSVDIFFKENSYIIFDAIINSNYDMLKWFKTKNICLNVRNEEGITPLIFAIIKNDKNLIEFILESNIDINYADEFGDTPLDYLCYYKRLYLIKKFYNMNAKLRRTTDSELLEMAIKKNKRDYLPIVFPSYIYRKNRKKRKV